MFSFDLTGLPAETVGPAEIPQAGEVLPQHTAPGLNFGKEVGFAVTVAMPQSFITVLSGFFIWKRLACTYTAYIFFFLIMVNSFSVHPVGGAKDSPTGSSEPGSQG